MSIGQRDPRQWTVMIHICRLTVPITVGYESVPVYLRFPRKWDYVSVLLVCPSISPSIISPQQLLNLAKLNQTWQDSKKSQSYENQCLGENQSWWQSWLWQGLQWQLESYLFSAVCHPAHQHMHWLASHHGCASDTAHAASCVEGILQTWEEDESNVHGALQRMKENWKNCREVTVILVGSTEAGHISPWNQTSQDLGLFIDFQSGGASV